MSSTTGRLSSWLEELDWIPVGIFYLDLSAAGTSLHLIAKLHPAFFSASICAGRSPRAGPLDSIRQAAGIRRRASDEILMPQPTCFTPRGERLDVQRLRRVSVTATVTADKGPQGIRLQSSHLTGIVHGLEGIDESALQELARETGERCTISLAIRGAVAVSSEVRIGAVNHTE